VRAHQNCVRRRFAVPVRRSTVRLWLTPADVAHVNGGRTISWTHHNGNENNNNNKRYESEGRYITVGQHVTRTRYTVQPPLLRESETRTNDTHINRKTRRADGIVNCNLPAIRCHPFAGFDLPTNANYWTNTTHTHTHPPGILFPIFI